MNLKQRFILIMAGLVIGITLLLISAVAIYALFLDETSYVVFEAFLKEHFWIAVLPPAFLLLLIGASVHWFGNHYILPLHKISEETDILVVNPKHRIQIPHSKTLQKLALSINATANHFDEMRDTIEQQIAKANQALSDEKNVLATLISRLESGILFTNADCQILLYNHAAAHHFKQTSDTNQKTVGGTIGLGRSLQGIIEPNLVKHAISEITQQQLQNRENISSQFVTNDNHNQLLAVQVLPVINAAAKLDGIIWIMHDVTNAYLQKESHKKLLAELSDGIRSSTAAIRAAIETVVDYPEMAIDHRSRFFTSIHTEAMSLSKLIEQTAGRFSGGNTVKFVRSPMLAQDLLATVQQTVFDKLSIEIECNRDQNEIWMQLDSFLIANTIAFLIQNIRANAEDSKQFSVSIVAEKSFANIDINWHSANFDRQLPDRWKLQLIQIANDDLSLTVSDVLDKHDAEMWILNNLKNVEKNNHTLRILIPKIEPQQFIPAIPGSAIESRPEFYDFDLFSRANFSLDLMNTPLENLNYTVFDTETTGLNPSAGDEMISIGAIRVVNQRMLQKEVFDQLIDPKRKLSKESTAIHGISPEMLIGQPTADSVLPAFHKFTKDTVLIAHNAAFDMRFLQLKEAALNLRFDQPVLDTLLLSAFAHPNQERHNLEAIAQRFGIAIVGRHTALGDAIVTAQVLLKLLPLLKKKGIRTLAEALESSKKTFYARIKY